MKFEIDIPEELMKNPEKLLDDYGLFGAVLWLKDRHELVNEYYRKKDLVTQPLIDASKERGPVYTVGPFTVKVETRERKGVLPKNVKKLLTGEDYESLINKGIIEVNVEDPDRLIAYLFDRGIGISRGDITKKYHAVSILEPK